VRLPAGRLHEILQSRTAPPDHFSRSRILAVLLPGRAEAGFLAPVAFRAGLALGGAV
jgi:hypothetical protein